jgi:hypothetical protein
MLEVKLLTSYSRTEVMIICCMVRFIRGGVDWSYLVGA